MPVASVGVVGVEVEAVCAATARGEAAWVNHAMRGLLRMVRALRLGTDERVGQPWCAVHGSRWDREGRGSYIS